MILKYMEVLYIRKSNFIRNSVKYELQCVSNKKKKKIPCSNTNRKN